MILLIDNYDSFVYNLYQYLTELGEEVQVKRNDKITVAEVLNLKPDYIVISPGPGTPKQAGISKSIISELGSKIPIMGVCLGHQCIGEVFGGKIVHAKKLLHGKTSEIYHDGKTIFSGIENPFIATRYHSLIVEKENLPDCLEISAWTSDGEIMGLRHKQFKIEGVQFHPESILTTAGKKIISNFLKDTKTTITIKSAIERVVNKKDLSEKEAEDVMDIIMSGEATPAQISAFITALRLKGETVDEITGCAKIMRQKATKIKTPQGRIVVDTCGTGGDKSHTFNISTVSAFVVAGCDIIVAKHGNRSVSSKCGSADLLQELGVNINLPSDKVEQCIEKIGIGFLFAPLLHKAMKYAIGPRREIGIRTIFNILGPLCNPADAKAQILGVYDENLTETLANVLKQLSVVSAYVVHGNDGLDEVTLTTTTKVSELKAGQVRTFQLDPREFGFKFCSAEELKAANIADNIKITMDILNGEKGPKRDVVLLNSALAIVSAGKVETIDEAIEIAKESIDSGKALQKLNALIEFSKAN